MDRLRFMKLSLVLSDNLRFIRFFLALFGVCLWFVEFSFVFQDYLRLVKCLFYPEGYRSWFTRYFPVLVKDRFLVSMAVSMVGIFSNGFARRGLFSTWRASGLARLRVFVDRAFAVSIVWSVYQRESSQ